MTSADTLQVTLAPGFRAEQEYILDVVLREFLGLSFELVGVSSEPVVTVSGHGKSLRLPQVLFGRDEKGGLAHSYPPPQLQHLDVVENRLPPRLFASPRLPVLYAADGQEGAWIASRGAHMTVRADVLGSCFFALTRLEEVLSVERDAHERFPSGASVAAREGFLRRPVVDEYVELLSCALDRLWPGLKQRRRQFTVRVSHDVDRPRAYADARLRDRLWLLRHHARSGALPPLYGSRLLNATAAAVRLPHRDPFDTFDWLMDADEGQGLRATYNFLCGGSTPYDGRYDIRSPPIRRLLRRVVNRGHEIGLHGSYATLDDASRLAAERQTLIGVLEEEGLEAEVTSGRQHYLRWRAPCTWRAWESAGLSVDSSVGYADTIGFRCGTSFEFPVFDLEARRALRLRERSLHVMDVALNTSTPSDMEQTLAAVDEVRAAAARHGGTFEVLWHNNVFAERQGESGLYARAIARVA